MPETVIALDVGGTKIAGAIVDGSRVLCREHVATPVGKGPEAVLAAMAAMAGRLRSTCPAAAAVGVGSAGMIDHRTGRVIYANDNLPGWTGVAIRDRLQEALRLPVTVDNDVNAMALAEARLGAAAGRRVAIVLAVGTGIGAALVFDGRLFRGVGGVAGEIGHIPVGSGGPRCACGNRGCLETYAAGPHIAAAYARAVGLTSPPDLTEVAALAHAGNGPARAAFARAGRYLGRALAGLANTLNPDVIVIGGGVLAARELILPPLRRSLVRYTLAVPLRSIAVVPASLGGDAGLLGAAQLAVAALSDEASASGCAHVR